MWRLLASLLLLAVVAFVAVALARPVPRVSLAVVRHQAAAFPGRSAAVVWPGGGEAALTVEGVGLLGSRRSDRPVPIASVTKIMTAYLILRAHPLAAGAAGPQITVTPSDVAVYSSDEAAGESVAAVSEGERLSERQALEALLVPSANNVATLLARWDAGSEDAFVAEMNAEAHALGLVHTHYRDASGVDASTVSTARDQVRLATAALKVPAFARIVAMRQVRLPVAGLKSNFDRLLGSYGIVGIKPGSTSAAGGCFVFAAHERVGGRVLTMVGAVLGQRPTAAQSSVGPPGSAVVILRPAFAATIALLRSASHVLERYEFPARGVTLGWLRAPWTQPVPVRPAESVSLVGWPGLPIRSHLVWTRNVSAPVRDGRRVGIAMVTAGAQHAEVSLVAAGALPTPSLAWRLRHP